MSLQRNTARFKIAFVSFAAQADRAVLTALKFSEENQVEPSVALRAKLGWSFHFLEGLEVAVKDYAAFIPPGMRKFQAEDGCPASSLTADVSRLPRGFHERAGEQNFRTPRSKLLSEVQTA
jgi:hypothetical protein